MVDIDKRIKELKGKQIWFPRGTSYWVGHCSKPILKITITAGGGMGGSRWNRYVEPAELKEGFNYLVNAVTGEEVMVNGAYIVEAEKYDMITAKYRCTNSNLNLDAELCIFSVICKNADEVLFMDDYKTMSDWAY